MSENKDKKKEDRKKEDDGEKRNVQSKRINILITGTPGTGKTTLCKEISKLYGFKYLHFGGIAKTIDSIKNSWNEDIQAFDLTEDDENLVMDEMEPDMNKGGCIVEHHDPTPFPERWFQLIIVLRAKTESIFDRLTARGYKKEKVTTNVDAEIFNVCKEGADESYDESIVYELQSDTMEDLTHNVSFIGELIKKAESSESDSSSSSTSSE